MYERQKRNTDYKTKRKKIIHTYNDILYIIEDTPELKDTC